MVRHVPLPAELSSRAFRVSEGDRSGLSEKRLRGPDLARPFHGVRQHRDLEPTGTRSALLRRCSAYALLLPPGHAFSHITAAMLWGVPLPEALERESQVHVAALDGSQRPRSRGVIGHEIEDVAVQRRSRIGLPVVDAASTWLQLAGVLEPDDLVAAGDHLVLEPRRQSLGDPRPYASREELAARVLRYRGRGKKAAAAALRLVREGAESRRETLLRLALVRHGLPEPELNAAIHDARGRLIGYGDLVFAAFKVVVEYDGEQHRTDAAQFYHDVERHEALEREGWIHLRETKETPIMGSRSTPVRTERALRSRGWPGT